MPNPDYRFVALKHNPEISYIQVIRNADQALTATYRVDDNAEGFTITLVSGRIPRQTYLQLRLFALIRFSTQPYLHASEFDELLEEVRGAEYGRGVSAGKQEALKYTPEEREAYGKHVAAAELFSEQSRVLKWLTDKWPQNVSLARKTLGL